MKVTQVSIRPTPAAMQAERPSLTPELLAASGARYSRNNEGLDVILSKIDPENLDKSVDSIFRMIDYGHQSIADMVPVAMFIDGLSIWLAYYVWSLCPTAGGQESSTRYIRLGVDGLPRAEDIGIAPGRREEWTAKMGAGFEAYEKALHTWDAIAEAYPELTRIPEAVLNDTSDKGKKRTARMRRNYAFDRARYYLPAAALTNMMMIMSARGWVQLCQYLLAYPLPEANRLGAAIREELTLCAPRMLKHADIKESYAQGLRAEFSQLAEAAKALVQQDGAGVAEEREAGSFLTITAPDDITEADLVADLRHHDNRYSWTGQSLKRTVVRFGWKAITLAEIRDLNRHRTGNKYCPLVPVGFYSAGDQMPDQIPELAQYVSALQTLRALGESSNRDALESLANADPAYVYWTLMGAQYGFEHVTTADKFLYEAELRTGIGAHYRYAQHLHDVLEIWNRHYPQTTPLILEGGAEPE